MKEELHITRTVSGRAGDQVRRVTCKLMFAKRTLATFTGATAERRAKEALKLAKRNRRKGLPLWDDNKVVADVGLPTACNYWRKNQSIGGGKLDHESLI